MDTPKKILEQPESVERTAALAAWLQGLYRGEDSHRRQVGAALSRLEVALQRWRLAPPRVEELRSWASEIPSGS